MRLRGPALAVAMLGLLAAAPTPTTADCGTESNGVPTLCDTTILTAERSSTMSLELVEEVVFAPSELGTFTGDGDSLEIEGSGALPGVVISQARADGTAHGVVASRVDPGEVGLEVARSFGDIDGDQARGFTLPAGTYHVTVLADEGVTTVTMRADAVAGEAHFTPTTAADVTIDRLDATFTDSPPVVGAGGAANELVGGVAVRAVYVGAGPHVVSRLGTCIYESSPDQGYLPGCPGAPLGQEPVFVSQFPAPAPTTGALVVGFSSVTTGVNGPDVAQGVWYESAGAVEQAGGVGAWISLGS